MIYIILLTIFISIPSKGQGFEEINSSTVIEFVKRNSSLNSLQEGYSNSIVINLNNPVKKLEIEQKGNVNRFNYSDIYNNNLIESKYLIKGNMNELNVIGTNNINEKINLEVKGHNKSITILNR